MDRTIKKATTKTFHYASIQELRRHVTDRLIAYNFAKQLKALKFRTPYDASTRYGNQSPPSHAGTKHLDREPQPCRRRYDLIARSDPQPASTFSTAARNALGEQGLEHTCACG